VKQVVGFGVTGITLTMVAVLNLTERIPNKSIVMLFTRVECFLCPVFQDFVPENKNDT